MTEPAMELDTSSLATTCCVPVGRSPDPEPEPARGAEVIAGHRACCGKVVSPATAELTNLSMSGTSTGPDCVSACAKPARSQWSLALGSATAFRNKTCLCLRHGAAGMDNVGWNKVTLEYTLLVGLREGHITDCDVATAMPRPTPGPHPPPHTVRRPPSSTHRFHPIPARMQVQPHDY